MTFESDISDIDQEVPVENTIKPKVELSASDFPSLNDFTLGDIVSGNMVVKVLGKSENKIRVKISGINLEKGSRIRGKDEDI